MTTQDPIETQAVALVQPHQEGYMPSDAKNKAISDLTAECYKQASKLTLTKEEISGLSADFADEAFQPGAAGKENLIYIEHASLRERLDQVIGMGQWCMIPIRRWEEPFVYQKERWANNRRTGQFDEVKGSHVYVDGMMLIRGAFVASAIGEMTYYPDNHTQNYGDAVEGAETAALRRCCKRIGIGLQAWRKDWCLGWWDRRNNKGKKKTDTKNSTGALNISTCPVIGVFSHDDYQNLCSLPKSDTEPSEQESNVLFNRLQESFNTETLSTTKPVAESFSLHWHKGGNIGIVGERRLVGERLLGVQGFVAIVLLRSGNTEGAKNVQSGSDDGKLQGGRGELDDKQTKKGTVGHSGGSGSRENPLPEPASVKATTKTRSWAINKIGADVVGPRRNCLHVYMVALKWIKEGETVEAWPLEHVPTNGADLQKLLIKLGTFEAEQRAEA